MQSKTIMRSLLVLLALSVSATAVSAPPDHSGPNVIRYEDFFVIRIADFDEGKQVIFGTHMLNFCNNIFDFETASIMDVSVPEDSNRINQMATGEVFASVWDFPEFSCARFLTEDPLAEGMATFRLTDNDVNTFLNTDNVNANAFGMNARGNMFSPGGVPLRFKLVWHVVWDGVDGARTFNEVLKISLR